ncbi:MAG: hypothetical protein G3M70_06350 [Candidatus Nitronauta litoralis]|uniref:Uncharacterized protein n=1 Tax=Candidatus Nitronauta litoralis TaxID=2705533 RepID=A0A7T0BV49_9BACT|nr:MAG: hypothetical protein G3M70_06350 [Candidatus Nitronauta litoralis]
MTPENPVAASIRHSIEKNGFPDKAVKLPFRPVYASCKQHGTPLAEVLTQLGEEGIIGTLTGDHILFQTPELAAESARIKQTKPEETDPEPIAPPSENPAPDPAGFTGNLEDLTKLAGNTMSQLSPEQLKSLKDSFDNMSPEEKMKLMQFYSNLFSNPDKK